MLINSVSFLTGDFLESFSERDFRSLVLSVFGRLGVWIQIWGQSTLTRFSGIADYMFDYASWCFVESNEFRTGFWDESAYCLDEKGGFGLLCSFRLCW